MSTPRGTEARRSIATIKLASITAAAALAWSVASHGSGAFQASADVAGGRAPVRVATLLPFVAEALGRLDGAVRVVATVRTDMKHPPAGDVVDLGSAHGPNFELLASSGAELVVAERALHGPLQEKLARGGGEVLVIDSSSVEGTFTGLMEVGRRVHAESTMAREVESARTAIRAQRLEGPRRAVILFGAPGTFMLATNRTWIGDLATTVGLENLAGGTADSGRYPGYVQVSDEMLAAMKPDVVLLIAHGDPKGVAEAFAERIESKQLWRHLGGDTRAAIHTLPPDVFSTNPGLRLADAARHLHTVAATPAGP